MRSRVNEQGDPLFGNEASAASRANRSDAARIKRREEWLKTPEGKAWLEKNPGSREAHDPFAGEEHPLKRKYMPIHETKGTGGPEYEVEPNEALERSQRQLEHVNKFGSKEARRAGQKRVEVPEGYMPIYGKNGLEGFRKIPEGMEKGTGGRLPEETGVVRTYIPSQMEKVQNELDRKREEFNKAIRPHVEAHKERTSGVAGDTGPQGTKAPAGSRTGRKPSFTTNMIGHGSSQQSRAQAAGQRAADREAKLPPKMNPIQPGPDNKGYNFTPGPFTDDLNQRRRDLGLPGQDMNSSIDKGKVLGQQPTVQMPVTGAATGQLAGLGTPAPTDQMAPGGLRPEAPQQPQPLPAFANQSVSTGAPGVQLHQAPQPQPANFTPQGDFNFGPGVGQPNAPFQQSPALPAIGQGMDPFIAQQSVQTPEYYLQGPPVQGVPAQGAQETAAAEYERMFNQAPPVQGVPAQGAQDPNAAEYERILNQAPQVQGVPAQGAQNPASWTPPPAPDTSQMHAAALRQAMNAPMVPAPALPSLSDIPELGSSGNDYADEYYDVWNQISPDSPQNREARIWERSEDGPVEAGPITPWTPPSAPRVEEHSEIYQPEDRPKATEYEDEPYEDSEVDWDNISRFFRNAGRQWESLWD